MWPFGGWGAGLGFIWFIAMMLFWILLLVLLVAGVIYVLRYLFVALISICSVFTKTCCR
jgi:hypothetical protein